MEGGLGTLYLVGTPIGNLEDISLRALRILKEVDVVAAEDTRVTRVLLRHYDISTPLTPFHEFSRQRALDQVLARLDQGDVALVSDAGTPGVSDPGSPLVRGALAAGHTVVPIPGASAVLAALIASGLPSHSFTFIGFLPRKSGQRRRLFAEHGARGETLIAFESPHRLRQALDDLAAVLPERPAVVARELTKTFEQFVRGTATEVAAHFTAQPPRGECTLLVAGRSAKDEQNHDHDE